MSGKPKVGQVGEVGEVGQVRQVGQVGEVREEDITNTAIGLAGNYCNFLCCHA